MLDPAGALLGVVSARDVMSLGDAQSDERPTAPVLARRGPALAGVTEALFCALDFAVRDVSAVPSDMPASQVAEHWAGYRDVPIIVVSPRRAPVGIIYGSDLAVVSRHREPRVPAPKSTKHTPYAQGVHP
jgi:hypothetical protein